MFRTTSWSLANSITFQCVDAGGLTADLVSFRSHLPYTLLVGCFSIYLSVFITHSKLLADNRWSVEAASPSMMTGQLLSSLNA